MSPALYPILFDQIKFFVEKFFDSQGQVCSLVLYLYYTCILFIFLQIPFLMFSFVQVVVADHNTQFIEHIIFVMKNVLDSKTDQPSEHLGVTSIEGMMLAIVR